jgi:hypothetical protein
LWLRSPAGRRVGNEGLDAGKNEEREFAQIPARVHMLLMMFDG